MKKNMQKENPITGDKRLKYLEYWFNYLYLHSHEQINIVQIIIIYYNKAYI